MATSPEWACQCSVDANVPVEVAWQFMSDVRNWSDPPAEFSLDGPFATGTRGATRMPGGQVNPWTLRDVDPGKAYTIEGGGFLERAFMLCHWRFDAVTEHQSRLTQRIELWGENAAAYVESIRSGFEPNLEPGMRRLAGLMESRFSATDTNGA
jgi:hypothetical protein